MIAALSYSAAVSILVAWNIVLGRRITARQSECDALANIVDTFHRSADDRLKVIETELHIRPSFRIRKQRTPDHVN